jgi:hypothetical protein
MNKKTNLILALQQLDNLEKLIDGFDYRDYLYSKVVKMRCELKRQLTNLQSEVVCDI